MLDPFLEREKELMKLNESLNNKIPFDLKIAKPCNSKKPTKIKPIKTLSVSKVEKTLKSPATPAKIIIDAKSKDPPKFATNFAKKTLPMQHRQASGLQKSDLDDQCFIDSLNFSTKSEQMKLMSVEQASPEEFDKKMNAITNEEINKANTAQSSAAELSLIPQNLFRRNVSSEGIIK